MLTALFIQLVNRSPKGRRAAFRGLFEYLARRSFHVTGWTQMNYGYAGDGTNPHTMALAPEDENERFCHQLYFKTVNGFDLRAAAVTLASSRWAIDHLSRWGGSGYLPRRHRSLFERNPRARVLASSPVLRQALYLVENTEVTRHWPWFAEAIAAIA